MMNVEIMWKEVYNDENDLQTIGKEAIKRWEHNNDSMKFWRVSANFIYFYKFNEQEWGLTNCSKWRTNS